MRLNTSFTLYILGGLFSLTALTANPPSVPMSSNVPAITIVKPPQENPPSDGRSNVSVRKARFVDPFTGTITLYEVTKFTNARGETVEEYKNTLTGHIATRITN